MLVPKLYNTLTRNLDPIVVRDGGVGIYCCGPTVYDVPHAGNARAALVPDVLVRLLRQFHSTGCLLKPTAPTAGLQK